MIKAISLIFEPVVTWDKIAVAKRNLGFVFLWFLTPLVLISVAAETAGIFYLGRRADDGEAIRVPREHLILYVAAELVVSYALVFIGAKAIKAVSETFHGRNTYARCFTVVAYTLSPFFLFRVLDVFPVMNPWATFGIGIVISVTTTLYHGVPRVLQPDPPDAFGVYLLSAFFLAAIAALMRFLTLLVLQGRVGLG
jgi:hypothetical protein